MWLHRFCCGLLGTGVVVAIGSVWAGEPPGTWRFVVSRCLLFGSVPAGILLACVAHRFSVAEGLAGDVGYDELEHQNEEKRPD